MRSPNCVLKNDCFRFAVSRDVSSCTAKVLHGSSSYLLNARPAHNVEETAFVAEYRIPSSPSKQAILIANEEFMQAVEPDWSVPDGVSQMWHFHPKYGWMNDPNGLFFLDGKWHVFYQYNPLGVTWGNMHWGHAVSSDLRHWSHLPIALYPDEWGTMYSGSAVIDTDNTAGFGKNAILLYYTNASYDSLQGMQCLAISTDNGITFNKFNDGQPVIGNITRDRDRDPNIAWDADANVWRLALYFGTSASKNRFGLFESKNLLDWTPSDVYEIPYGAECPGIRPMQDEATGQTRWLFFDASCRYLVGDISRDGRIHFENQEPRCFFYGAAYAGQCFFGAPDNKNIYLAWLRMKPAQERQWTGCLSCPIELRLNNGELLVRPYHGFDDGDKALLKDFLVESPIGAAGHGMVLRDTFTAEYFDASERFAVGCV